MKKILCMVISLLFVFCIWVPSGATDVAEGITDEEAKALILTAYNSNILFRCKGGYTKEGIEQTASSVFIGDFVPMAWKLCSWDTSLFDQDKLKKDEYVRLEETLHIESWQSLSRDSVGFLMVGYTLYWPSGYIKENGGVISYTGNAEQLLASKEDVSIVWVEKTSGKAMCKLKVWRYALMSEFTLIPCYVHVEFQKTANGWRISGGDFAEWILLGEGVWGSAFDQERCPIYRKPSWDIMDRWDIDGYCLHYALGDTYYQSFVKKGLDITSDYVKSNRNHVFDHSEYRFIRSEKKDGEIFDYVDVVMIEKSSGNKVFVEAVLRINKVTQVSDCLVDSPFLDLLNGKNDIPTKPYVEPEFTPDNNYAVKASFLRENVISVDLTSITPCYELYTFLTALDPDANTKIIQSPNTGDDTPRTVLFCTAAGLVSAFGAHAVLKRRREENR